MSKLNFSQCKIDSMVLQPTGELIVSDALNIAKSKMIKLSVIIPTYNESKNIEAIIKEITLILEPIIPQNYEIIIVDDDSHDQTWRIAQELTEQYKHLRVMRRKNEKGLSTAVIRGWQVAMGKFLAVIDGDLQHPPEVLCKLLNKIEKNRADLCVASRNIEGGGVSEWSLIRRIISRGAQVIGIIVCHNIVSRVSDPMSGYFIVRRSAICNRQMYPQGYKILLEVIGRGNIDKICEEGYVFQERKEGESKISTKLYFEYIFHLFRLRFATFPVKRFIKFCFVGLSGVFLDMGLLFLLSDPLMLGWGLTRSKVIAAQSALVSNFMWNDKWTFHDLAKNDHGLKQKFRRFLKFQLICTIGIVINVVILNLLFNLMDMNRYIANGIAILATTGWNFWLNYKLGWNNNRSNP